MLCAGTKKINVEPRLDIYRTLFERQFVRINRTLFLKKLYAHKSEQQFQANNDWDNGDDGTYREAIELRTIILFQFI